MITMSLKTQLVITIVEGQKKQKKNGQIKLLVKENGIGLGELSEACLSYVLSIPDAQKMTLRTKM